MERQTNLDRLACQHERVDLVEVEQRDAFADLDALGEVWTLCRPCPECRYTAAQIGRSLFGSRKAQPTCDGG